MKKIVFFFGISLFFCNILYAQILPEKKGMVGLQIYELDKKFFVGKVFAGSPAERAGFKNGDELLQVSDKPLTGLSLQEVLDLFDGDPGLAVDVKITRDNQQVQLNVNRVSPENLVEDSPDFKNVVSEKASLEGSHESLFSQTGLLPEELENQYSDFFYTNYGFRGAMIDQTFAQNLGTFFNEGFLVFSIDKTSPAADKLKKWDLIVKINNQKINNFFTSSGILRTPPNVALPILNLTLMTITGEVQISIKPKAAKKN